MGRRLQSSQNFQAAKFNHRNQSYKQHENRTWVRPDLQNKRVSFRSSSVGWRGRRGGGNGASGIIRALERDTESGSTSDQAGRSRPMRGVVRSGVTNRLVSRARELVSQSGGRTGLTSSGAGGVTPWLKVTISHASKYDKKTLMNRIVSQASGPIFPIAFNKQGPNVVFYVEGKSCQDVARKLASSEPPIVMDDNFTLVFRVQPSPPPTQPLDQQVTEQIKIVMSSRYSPENKALNLKAFHKDANFISSGIYAPLNRNNVFAKVVDVIGEHLGTQLEAVDLSGNRIRDLTHFTTFTDKAPHVKILYLADNQIVDFKELRKCMGWKLVEIRLSGNGGSSKFLDTTNYHKFLRRIFPTLQVLNGADMPKEISFDDGAANQSSSNTYSRLLPSIPKMTVNPEVESVVLKFLHQYLTVFDSEDRTQLLEAYHSKAVMSLSVAYSNVNRQKIPESHKLHAYLYESRNLLRIQPERRLKLLRQGKLSIASFLQDVLVRPTKHILESLTLDISFATSALMSFTVTGINREGPAHDKKEDDIYRHFARNFIVVPQGSGFCIVNETLFITHASPAECKKANDWIHGKSGINTSSTAAGQIHAGQSSSGMPDFSSPPPPIAPQQLQQQNTVKDRNVILCQFQSMSSMNSKWCEICLNQTNWDLTSAFNSFQTAKSEGKIPPEAFIL